VGRTLDRPGRYWPGCLFFVALAGTPSAAQTLAVPAVPYLAQSEALCGGAALAMVLRYWGMPDVRPEDFAGSLNPEGTGIPADALRRLTEARGFQAFAFSGGPPEAVSHLEKGRPLIALLSTAPERHHYVVMLAWANHPVLVHDPAVGPFRIIPESEWLGRWNPTGRWALLVLPPDGLTSRAQPSPSATQRFPLRKKTRAPRWCSRASPWRLPEAWTRPRSTWRRLRRGAPIRRRLCAKWPPWSFAERAGLLPPILRPRPCVATHWTGSAGSCSLPVGFSPASVRRRWPLGTGSTSRVWISFR